MDLDSYPKIPTDLIEQLERQYPDEHPDAKEARDHHTVLINTGIIQVIRFLRRVHDLQSTTVLGDTNVQST